MLSLVDNNESATARVLNRLSTAEALVAYKRGIAMAIADGPDSIVVLIGAAVARELMPEIDSSLMPDAAAFNDRKIRVRGYRVLYDASLPPTAIETFRRLA